MALVLVLTVMLSIVVLFGSCLAHAFGNEPLYGWTTWIGWGGMTTAFFAGMGLGALRVLLPLAPRRMRFFSLPAISAGENTARELPTNRWHHFRWFGFFGLLVLSATVAVHGMYEGLRVPRVKAVDIAVARLPTDLEGLRIVQLTDLHLSSMTRPDWVRKIVSRVNYLSPDIIAVTGDIVDGAPAEIQRQTAPLAELTARMGKYFVTGNHEYFNGARLWTAAMSELGFTVLENEHRVLGKGTGLVLVAGVPDYSAPALGGGDSSPIAAIEAAPDADVKVLLAHQPRSAEKAALAGFHLQLSGHTHGGQFGPANWLREWGQPYQSGLYVVGNMQLYVSNGTGYWGPPVRLGAPAEITLLRLTAASDYR